MLQFNNGTDQFYLDLTFSNSGSNMVINVKLNKEVDDPEYNPDKGSWNPKIHQEIHKGEYYFHYGAVAEFIKDFLTSLPLSYLKWLGKDRHNKDQIKEVFQDINQFIRD